jgi:aryl-alcohol dehydrogenase-like predicted oxidoreductase
MSNYLYNLHPIRLTFCSSEGKIKYIGLSEVSSTTLRRAHRITPVDAVQIEYSLFVLDIEGPAGTDLLATCRELGVAIVAYAPLGRGLLTGAFGNKGRVTGSDDARLSTFPRFAPENIEANIKLVDRLKEFADRKRCTPSQLAIAWLLKQGADIIPIPGTKKIKYLEENWGALEVELTDGEVAEIRKFVETAEIAGGRYFEGAMAQTFSDTREESNGKQDV